MIDLHTHTLFSDGQLLPSELVYRAKEKGYTTICLSDHIDFSNIDFIIPRTVAVAKELTQQYKILVIPGAEISCVPPKDIPKAIKLARKLGAKIVLVHGEAENQPVPEGTNLSGLLSKADIIAHPGLITDEEVTLSVENNVLLEISSRKIYSSSNYHIAKLAKKFNAKLVFNSDAHSPNDLITEEILIETLKTAKLTKKDFEQMQQNAIDLISGKK